MITVKCACGMASLVPDDTAGQRIKCPACGKVLPLPEAQASRVESKAPRGEAKAPSGEAPTPRGLVDRSTAQPIDAILAKGPLTIEPSRPPVQISVKGPRTGRDAIADTDADEDEDDESAHRWPVIVGGVVGLACVLGVGLWLLTRGRGGSEPPRAAEVAAARQPVAVPPRPDAEPAPVPRAVVEPAPAPAPPPMPPRSLTAREIVEQASPSVAFVVGTRTSGSAFLVLPGVLATTAQVLGQEPASHLSARFPAAPAGQQGPYSVEVVYFDEHRDLAMLRVATDLPPLELAPAGPFRAGQIVTILGGPDQGAAGVLPGSDRPSRPLTTRTNVGGLEYDLLGAPVDPSQSGGPALGDSGRVVAMAALTLGDPRGIGSCIPLEDLRAAVEKTRHQTSAQAQDAARRQEVAAARFAARDAGRAAPGGRPGRGMMGPDPNDPRTDHQRAAAALRDSDAERQRRKGIAQEYLSAYGSAVSTSNSMNRNDGASFRKRKHNELVRELTKRYGITADELEKIVRDFRDD